MNRPMKRVRLIDASNIDPLCANVLHTLRTLSIT